MADVPEAGTVVIGGIVAGVAESEFGLLSCRDVTAVVAHGVVFGIFGVDAEGLGLVLADLGKEGLAAHEVDEGGAAHVDTVEELGVIPGRRKGRDTA